jgi:hypothetical protein
MFRRWKESSLYEIIDNETDINFLIKISDEIRIIKSIWKITKKNHDKNL